MKVLDHISNCHTIHERLVGMRGEQDSKDHTLMWLGLYEFEAKLFLGHADVDQVLRRISSLPFVEAKTLETMAALCIQTGL